MPPSPEGLASHTEDMTSPLGCAVAGEGPGMGCETPSTRRVWARGLPQPWRVPAAEERSGVRAAGCPLCPSSELPTLDLQTVRGIVLGQARICPACKPSSSGGWGGPRPPRSRPTQALWEGSQEGNGVLKSKIGPPAPPGTCRAVASAGEVLPIESLGPTRQELLDLLSLASVPRPVPRT